MSPEPAGVERGVVVWSHARDLLHVFRPQVWVVLQDLALDAEWHDGRLTASSSARLVAEHLRIDPGTAATALRALRPAPATRPRRCGCVPTTPDQQVAVALSRIPDTTMAAVNHPWSVDNQLREFIADHQDILDHQPPDRQRQLDHAVRQLADARTTLNSADTAVDNARHDLDGIGVLAALTRHGRAQRRTFENQLSSRHAAAIDAAGSVAGAETQVARLTREQAAHDRHQQDHGWRRDAISTQRRHRSHDSLPAKLRRSERTGVPPSGSAASGPRRSHPAYSVFRRNSE